MICLGLVFFKDLSAMEMDRGWARMEAGRPHRGTFLGEIIFKRAVFFFFFKEKAKENVTL